jgi:hypothetical protein
MEPGLQITATFPSRHLHIGSKFKTEILPEVPSTLGRAKEKRDTAKDHCMHTAVRKNVELSLLPLLG